ncbi:RING finger protein 151 [Patella vulgata]|uniref:RING finger protein 151 n=1 Tax=Patella vulgata TaxID=6465 RepID=UPI00217F7C7A|nr:RING finger protein 151 [Patella vulgata]
MGYNINKFIGSVDPNLLCGVCGGVFENAVLTSCGHSFCLECLKTWLNRPQTNSCPECRTLILYDSVKPILSMRSLINGLNVQCDHVERGCKVVVKLERLAKHLDTCTHFPIRCEGCDEVVNRYELASHQIQCQAIASTIDDEGPILVNRGKAREDEPIRHIEISDLLFRITTLELQLKKLRRDLQEAECRNDFLEREYRKARDELQQKHQDIVDIHLTDFDSDYSYGMTSDSICKLSLLIARCLLRKPSYIESDRIFTCIKRCYEKYFRCGNEYEHDVHMLLATSYASNWFSPCQRLSLNCWLQCIVRYRQHTRYPRETK